MVAFSVDAAGEAVGRSVSVRKPVGDVAIRALRNAKSARWPLPLVRQEQRCFAL